MGFCDLNFSKKLQMSQNLQNFIKFQKFQLENLVDFEKCCKAHIYLQISEPIQPKTSNILPKFCQPSAATPRRVGYPTMRLIPHRGSADLCKLEKCTVHFHRQARCRWRAQKRTNNREDEGSHFKPQNFGILEFEQEFRRGSKIRNFRRPVGITSKL